MYDVVMTPKTDGRRNDMSSTFIRDAAFLNRFQSV